MIKCITKKNRITILVFTIFAIGSSIFFTKKNVFSNFRFSQSVNQKKVDHVSIYNFEKNINSSFHGSKEFLRRARYLSDIDLPVYSLSEFQGFLDENGRSVESLVAVYLLTSDKSLIQELKKYTSDSEALLCTAMASSLPMAERKKFAQTYCELNPLQMQGHLFLAHLDIEEGRGNPKDPDAFLDLVNKGISSEEISLGLDRSTSNQRKALEYIGTHPLDAEAILASSNLKSFELISCSEYMMKKANKMELARATTEISKVEIVKKYLSAAESIKELFSYSSLRSAEWSHFSLMKNLAEQLPLDTQLGDEWGTVEQLKRKLRAEYDEMLKNSTKSGDFLLTSPPEILNNFLKIRLESGPQAASKWLKEQSEKR